MAFDHQCRFGLGFQKVTRRPPFFTPKFGWSKFQKYYKCKSYCFVHRGHKGHHKTIKNTFGVRDKCIKCASQALYSICTQISKKTAKTSKKNCNHHTLRLRTNHKMSVKDFVKQLNMGCNPFQDMHENSKSHVHASNIEYNVKLMFVDVNVFGAKV